jgi:hypothetical protein
VRYIYFILTIFYNNDRIFKQKKKLPRITFAYLELLNKSSNLGISFCSNSSIPFSVNKYLVARLRMISLLNSPIPLSRNRFNNIVKLVFSHCISYCLYERYYSKVFFLFISPRIEPYS